jgi:hypothetical protein
MVRSSWNRIHASLTRSAAPPEQSIGQIEEFQKLFLALGFLAYIGVLISISLSVIFYFGPRHGTKNMFWYISVCSLIGGISVSVTTGLGAAIVTTAQGQNQFTHWFIYFLLAFVVITLRASGAERFSREG